MTFGCECLQPVEVVLLGCRECNFERPFLRRSAPYSHIQLVGARDERDHCYSQAGESVQPYGGERFGVAATVLSPPHVTGIIVGEHSDCGAMPPNSWSYMRTCLVKINVFFALSISWPDRRK
jgi:hypothetical protein